MPWAADHLSDNMMCMASKQSATNKVLAIGMVNSIHFARWLSSAKGINAKFTIFPSGPNRRVHPIIGELVAKERKQVSLSKPMAFLSLPIWLMDRFLGGELRALILRVLLQIGPFDSVHFHEMQSGEYPFTLLPAACYLGQRCSTPHTEVTYSGFRTMLNT